MFSMFQCWINDEANEPVALGSTFLRPHDNIFFNQKIVLIVFLLEPPRMKAFDFEAIFVHFRRIFRHSSNKINSSIISSIFIEFKTSFLNDIKEDQTQYFLQMPGFPRLALGSSNKVMQWSYMKHGFFKSLI